MKYRKEPVVVEAFQWFGDNRQTEDPEWIVEAIKNGKAKVDFVNSLHRAIPVLRITTLEDIMTANQGDYIIQGIQGEIYPCKQDIFEATYVNIDDIPLPPEDAGIRWIKNGKLVKKGE